MAREFEVVSNPQFRNLHVFLVRMLSRMPHIHREIEIGFLLQGDISLRVGSESHHLEKMDGYIINSLESHEFHSEGQDATILAVQVSPRIFEAFLSEVPVIRYQGSACLREAVSNPDQYDSLLQMCIRLAQSYTGRYAGFEYDCFAITASLLAELNHCIPSRTLSGREWLPFRQRMERVMVMLDYIDANYRRKLLLEELAQREGLTLTYLSHLFRDTLGMSFQDYIKKKRYEHARAQILATRKNLLEISLESGFSDTRYMIRMFEEEFSCSPREYRKRHPEAQGSNGADKNDSQVILDEREAGQLLKGLLDL